MNDQLSFGSLDVTNLYGSIPLEDNNGEPGLITVMTNFFSDHHQSSIYPELHPIDFTQLLRVTLYEDVYAHQNVTKKQTKGIAMGNCAAPPLAIVYMHAIETKIQSRSESITLWKRYIDDIFFISTSEPTDLLNIANSVCSAIQFTLEEPVDGKLPFLDTLVHYSREMSSFSYEVYIKPTHSGTCLPFDSYVPRSRKKALVISETLRAKRNASQGNELKSQNKLTARLIKNGYSQNSLIMSSRKSATRPRNNWSTSHTFECHSYLKAKEHK
jgi:hypothetical protein